MDYTGCCPVYHLCTAGPLVYCTFCTLLPPFALYCWIVSSWILDTCWVPPLPYVVLDCLWFIAVPLITLQLQFPVPRWLPHYALPSCVTCRWNSFAARAGVPTTPLTALPSCRLPRGCLRLPDCGCWMQDYVACAVPPPWITTPRCCLPGAPAWL